MHGIFHATTNEYELDDDEPPLLPCSGLFFVLALRGSGRKRALPNRCRPRNCDECLADTAAQQRATPHRHSSHRTAPGGSPAADWSPFALSRAPTRAPGTRRGRVRPSRLYAASKPQQLDCSRLAPLRGTVRSRPRNQVMTRSGSPVSANPHVPAMPDTE